MKNKDGNPSIKSTRQMRTQENTTQRKNKSKQSTKNQVKTLCKEDLLPRNDNQRYNNEGLKLKNCHCHKLASYGGALVMMCERDEEPRPSAAAIELWIHTVYSKKQALRRLKK
jgi:hypothetical protein